MPPPFQEDANGSPADQSQYCSLHGPVLSCVRLRPFCAVHGHRPRHSPVPVPGTARSGNGALVVFPRRVQRDLFPRPPGGPRAVFRGGHSIRRPDCGIPSFSARVRRGGPGASRPWLCLRRDGRVAASFPRTLFSPADMERAVRYLRSAGVPLKERY